MGAFFLCSPLLIGVLEAARGGTLERALLLSATPIIAGAIALTTKSPIEKVCEDYLEFVRRPADHR